ncbi:MAG TPA: hypothetical protein VFS15_26970, partial [Kofleriaceae bacterium]|nr:hypothetical protein [Kofleriaceae bacterium]
VADDQLERKLTLTVDGKDTTLVIGNGVGSRRTALRLAGDARVVVFGSSVFVSDDILGLARQMDADFAASNLELVHNAVDWTLADTDLLQIRSRNAAARALTVPPDKRDRWRDINLAIALIGLVLVVVLARLRRRAIEPIVVKES